MPNSPLSLNIGSCIAVNDCSEARYGVAAVGSLGEAHRTTGANKGLEMDERGLFVKVSGIHTKDRS
jgi:hypothetical protein